MANEVDRITKAELARQLGVSKAYISMIMSGKKKPSKRIMSSLNRLRVNQQTVNFEARNPILSHARLPIPTLPRM
ncbi:helix-turn-helix domain-containing protein [Chloroflexota bacterium]